VGAGGAFGARARGVLVLRGVGASEPWEWEGGGGSVRTSLPFRRGGEPKGTARGHGGMDSPRAHGSEASGGPGVAGGGTALRALGELAPGSARAAGSASLLRQQQQRLLLEWVWYAGVQLPRRPPRKLRQ
jgi:hypothetical protein